MPKSSISFDLFQCRVISSAFIVIHRVILLRHLCAFCLSVLGFFPQLRKLCRNSFMYFHTKFFPTQAEGQRVRSVYCECVFATSQIQNMKKVFDIKKNSRFSEHFMPRLCVCCLYLIVYASQWVLFSSFVPIYFSVF